MCEFVVDKFIYDNAVNFMTGRDALADFFNEHGLEDIQADLLSLDLTNLPKGDLQPNGSWVEQKCISEDYFVGTIYIPVHAKDCSYKFLSISYSTY